MRDSFVFYRSFFEAIEIQPKNVQADIYAAIFDYVFNNKLPEGLTSIAQSMFILIKPQIDANNQRYENGKKGGAPKGNQNARKIFTEDNQKQPLVDLKNNQKQPNDNVNDNENVNVNHNVNENVDIGGEPEHCSDSSLTEPAVMQIVLNDKSFFDITQKQADEWKELFPAVDVMQELRKMKAWCDANPERRKTRRGVNRFIVSWLGKEQDKGRAPINTASKPTGNKFANYNQRQYDYDDIERAEMERLRKEVNAD